MSSQGLTSEKLKIQIELNLSRIFGLKTQDATEEQMYVAICTTVKDILTHKRLDFKKRIKEEHKKKVYYMSMEFLLGRSLRNHLFNLDIKDMMSKACGELGYDMERIYDIEPDAGLGNGGLGRLAAAYMDSLTSCGYMASGFSIKYDYGIFKQKIVDGWQMELPDDWLKNGDVWLAPRVQDTFEVHFNGKVEQEWVNDELKIKHTNYTTVLAVPYDMNISGYNSDAVNAIKLWAAKSPTDFDMNLFSRGEYVKAIENKALAESISKVLYPADDHIEGKSLRLKQQYFFVSASLQLILKKYLETYDNLDELGKHVAIHINDTHPTLCIPELMRLLLDNYGYGWDKAWSIVENTISYTNHTVMAEALEVWPQSLFTSLLPRIYQIISEINQRFCAILWDNFPNDWEKVSNNAILSHGQIRMPNLCLYASHTINGVSELHSNIIKENVFKDYNTIAPYKFTNVTNGITHRRWLCECNPELSELITSIIGDDFKTDAMELENLLKYQSDNSVLDKLSKIKYNNKVKLANYIKNTNGIIVNPESIFHAQVKRLHEYKRQLLNAFNILDLYYKLKENPDLDIAPQTFIFGAKAAGSYYMAKLIIRLICVLQDVINNDKSIKDKIKIVFLENYRVTLAEIIMPATEVSEQISIAGKEASGTGNMKFMINGAITMGTMDGANVEIHERVGDENIFIFGLLADEVEKLYRVGYHPTLYYNNCPSIKKIIDTLRAGLKGINFTEIVDSLTLGRNGIADPYMVLADFDSYRNRQLDMEKVYRNESRWNRMSLVNIAKSGFFSSDRSVREYAGRIWGLDNK